MFGTRVGFVVLVSVAALCSSAEAAGVELGLVAGFTVPDEAQQLTVDGEDAGREVGDDVLGLEVRVDDLVFGTFAIASYAVAGLFGEVSGDNNLSIRTHYVTLGLGGSWKIGRGQLGGHVGAVYVNDDFMVERSGESQPTFGSSDIGIGLGVRVAAPMSETVVISLNYGLVGRSVDDLSGTFPNGSDYVMSRGGVDHFFLAGVSVRLK